MSMKGEGRIHMNLSGMRWKMERVDLYKLLIDHQSYVLRQISQEEALVLSEGPLHYV